jgi:hypothetical protein
MRSKALEPNRVTLIVYGWDENQPGTLAWVFPSLVSAMRAVRALKNAARWLIVAGGRFAKRDRVDVDEVRKKSLVLIEKPA